MTNLMEFDHSCLLYVGSMAERKGLDLLLNALQFVRSDFKLRIVGNGSAQEVSKLKKIAVKNSIEDKIEFCGFKQGNELQQEYSKAQIFVFPTREDCFGLVLVEALCSGLPIISSKYADGAYDVINPGINGILIDPYNAKTFGETIEKVINKSIRLKGTCSELVKKFSYEQTIQGYLDAIDYVTKKEKTV